MLLHPDLHEFWECELGSSYLHVNPLPPNLSPQPEMGEIYLFKKHNKKVAIALVKFLWVCVCVYV